jgi:hypothetical protein
MNSHARDSRPADRSAYARLHPPPDDRLFRSTLSMTLVLLARTHRRAERHRSSAPDSRH